MSQALGRDAQGRSIKHQLPVVDARDAGVSQRTGQGGRAGSGLPQLARSGYGIGHDEIVAAVKRQDGAVHHRPRTKRARGSSGPDLQSALFDNGKSRRLVLASDDQHTATRLGQRTRTADLSLGQGRGPGGGHYRPVACQPDFPLHHDVGIKLQPAPVERERSS
ncbi:hypothetical protein D3C87_1460260 [compost metagenome]